MGGSFILNQVINGTSEASSVILAYVMNQYFNKKRSLVVAFLVAAVSCTIIMISEMTGNTDTIPIGVVGGKGGITIAFNFFYIITVDYFTP